MKIFLLILFLLAFTGAGAYSMQSNAMQEAETLFQAQKWAEAATAFEGVTKAEPSNARAWMRLGSALFSIGDYERGARAFSRAVELTNSPVAMYNLACAHSRLNEVDKASEWLGKALDAKFPQPGMIANDPDLSNLRKDARYKEIAARVDKLLHPCAQDPVRRQFDFWIGEWDVKATASISGPSVGASRIEVIEGGCIILENWTGAAGGTGKSMNFYDAGLEKWRQVWVDSSGNVSEFAGEFRDKAMRFDGESRHQSGAKILRRLTFFNLGPDRVRQFSEMSTDGGKTWTVGYDFTYIRKK